MFLYHFYRTKKKSIHIQAVGYSVGQAMMSFVLGTSFYVAAVVVNYRFIPFGDLFV